MPIGTEPTVKSSCMGECLKQEWDAKSTTIKHRKRSTDNNKDCPPDLTLEEETDITKQIEDQLKGEIVLKKECQPPSSACLCEWGSPPAWPKTYDEYPFSFTVEKPHPKIENKKCVYTVEGTVTLATRLIRGVCKPDPAVQKKYPFKGKIILKK